MSEIDPIPCNLPFYGPGVVHVAGDPGEFGGWYQECAVCGEVLQDYTDLTLDGPPRPWAPGTRISVSPERPGFRYQADELLHDGDTLCAQAAS